MRDRATTPDECAHWRYLDEMFGTDPDSPLHHDNRCALAHPERTPCTTN